MVPEAERSTTLDNIRQSTPIGRIGLPEDIGYIVLFLCSEMSSYITGQMLNVGGGIPMSRYREGSFIRGFRGG